MEGIKFSLKDEKRVLEKVRFPRIIAWRSFSFQDRILLLSPLNLLKKLLLGTFLNFQNPTIESGRDQIFPEERKKSLKKNRFPPIIAWRSCSFQDRVFLLSPLNLLKKILLGTFFNFQNPTIESGRDQIFPERRKKVLEKEPLYTDHRLALVQFSR